MKIKVLHLTKKVCVDPNDAQSAQFVQWLLDVDYGKDLVLIIHFLSLST